MSVVIPQRKDSRACLFAMSSMSPSAKKMIEQEYFRFLLDDDDSEIPDNILRQLFLCVLSDLRDLGMIFDIDFDTVYFDDQMFILFINLCWVLFPNSLYPILKTSTEFSSVIRGICDGSIGDDGPAFHTYLRELSGDDTGHPLVDGLQEIILYLYPNTQSNSVFMDYLQTMVLSLDEDQLTPDVDPLRSTAFLSFVKDMLWRVNTFIERASLSDTDLLVINRTARIWSNDLQKPENAILYHYLFLEDPTTLPPGIALLWKKRHLDYRVSCYLFLEYYTTRLISVPSHNDTLRLLLGCYLFNTTKEQFLASCEAIQQRIPKWVPDYTTLASSLYPEGN